MDETSMAPNFSISNFGIVVVGLVVVGVVDRVVKGVITWRRIKGLERLALLAEDVGGIHACADAIVEKTADEEGLRITVTE